MPEWIKIFLPVVVVAMGWLWYASEFRSEVMLRLRSVDDLIENLVGDIKEIKLEQVKFRDEFFAAVRVDDRQDRRLELIEKDMERRLKYDYVPSSPVTSGPK